MNAPAERLTYTVPESAALTGLSERTLWKLVRAGALPVVHVGRRTLVSRAALLAFIAQHESAGATSADRAQLGAESVRLRVMP
jgi:excisionase family DNA binding protein